MSVTRITEGLLCDRVPIVRLESELLQVEVAPAIGGKIVSLVDKSSGYQFLWRNRRLELCGVAPGSAYDPSFWGGIDELIPNDAPETINGLPSPDHGELWTMPLDYRLDGQGLVLWGTLPRCGIRYEKRLTLRTDGPILNLDYRLNNPSGGRRAFMWKLHAALNIGPGDRIICPAGMARVIDPAWSRWHDSEPFAWPTIEGQQADIIPAADGTTDFLYLYQLRAGQIAWVSAARKLTFRYSFDQHVFPYAQYFASYGGLDGHYTAILEPCSSMPLMVSDADRLGQCSVLMPEEGIETRVAIYAGPCLGSDQHWPR